MSWTSLTTRSRTNQQRGDWKTIKREQTSETPLTKEEEDAERKRGRLEDVGGWRQTWTRQNKERNQIHKKRVQIWKPYTLHVPGFPMVEPLQRLHFLLSPFCLCNVVFAVCSMTVHKKKHNTGGDRAVLYRNRPSSEIIFFFISKECLAKKKQTKRWKSHTDIVASSVTCLTFF